MSQPSSQIQAEESVIAGYIESLGGDQGLQVTSLLSLSLSYSIRQAATAYLPIVVEMDIGVEMKYVFSSSNRLLFWFGLAF